MEITVAQLTKELSPKVHYHIHNSLTLVYVLSKMKSIHTVTFFTIHFNL